MGIFLILVLGPINSSYIWTPLTNFYYEAVFIIGEAIFLPLPNKIFTTPGGKASLKASSRGVISNTPNFAGLKMAVLPIINAGINKENVVNKSKAVGEPTLMLAL